MKTKEIKLSWKAWAAAYKLEVHQTAQKYSGNFVLTLTKALLHADLQNTMKMLNTWPEYFEDLYKLYKKKEISKCDYCGRRTKASLLKTVLLCSKAVAVIVNLCSPCRRRKTYDFSKPKK